ncbi:protein CDV3 homolog [Drosophila persimilis]|uniref:protein CDV3 homolog n=1 Tax=Drosophila persimilis TaxID=7234 RepID=UPI000F083D2A|nr:protein CDV3 homolog [Drosophila persimilis]XP_026847713.1 protein CDV3 homolog isoform X1 [Drosophila persimilis]XP_026847714.1 protein CDV3 homolog isoform X2 [Drosophila persimilis]XP_026847717.1 protein CDV3 homolog [Drosophila persimilis]
MSNLEDFFSKKDNKKSKRSAEYLAAEELYKTLEESTKYSSEDNSNLEDAFQSEASGTDSKGASASLKFGIRFSDEAFSEEDEWSDFTEENRRQFTYVPRTLSMALTSPVPAPAPFAGDDLKEEPEQLDTGGDGVDVGSKDGERALATTCPWQKSEQDSQGQSDRKANTPVVKKQIYIPPALRQSQGDFNKRKAQPLQRKAPSTMPFKPQAPDLNSLEYFPSLSDSKILKRPK